MIKDSQKSKIKTMLSVLKGAYRVLWEEVGYGLPSKWRIMRQRSK